MSRTKVGYPVFPRAPKEYTERWAAEMQRELSALVNIIANPGEGRNTLIVLTNLQNDDVGLEAGSLYKDGNLIKVSVLNTAAVSGASMTATSGSVTIDIT